MRNLEEIARAGGDPWKAETPYAPYYDDAEHAIDVQWQQIGPWLDAASFAVCVDLACGHGRNTRKLLEQPSCRQVYCVDINEDNITVCTKRFAEDPRVKPLRTDGADLIGIADGEVSLLYSFDSMVHFDSDIVRSYLSEARRILAPGGRAFLHHSNLTAFPGVSQYNNPENPGSRNFMSEALLAHYAIKEGLEVIRQEPIDWSGDGRFTDCFSLVGQPF